VSAANAGVMSLAPKKAGEMYGVASTKWTDFFAQWAGIMMFGQSLTAYLTLVHNMAMPKALAWGMVPSLIASLQDFLNDRMVGEMGMSDAAKYMPMLVNTFLTLGLFGKVPNVDAELVMKIGAVWMGVNGLHGYFATDAWMNNWGANGLTAVDKGMGKLMAQTMIGGASYIVASVFGGKSDLEAYGTMMAVYALGSIDGSFISKTTEAMGVESSKALFWAAIQLATAAAIFL